MKAIKRFLGRWSKGRSRLSPPGAGKERQGRCLPDRAFREVPGQQNGGTVVRICALERCNMLSPVRMLRHDFRMPEPQAAAVLVRRLPQSVLRSHWNGARSVEYLVSKMGNCHLPAPVQSEGGKQPKAASGPRYDATFRLVPGAPDTGSVERPAAITQQESGD